MTFFNWKNKAPKIQSGSIFKIIFAHNKKSCLRRGALEAEAAHLLHELQLGSHVVLVVMQPELDAVTSRRPSFCNSSHTPGRIRYPFQFTYAYVVLWNVDPYCIYLDRTGLEISENRFVMNIFVKKLKNIIKHLVHEKLFLITN